MGTRDPEFPFHQSGEAAEGGFMHARKSLLRGALAVLVGVSGLLASAAPAAAYVVCDRWGRCWHAHRHYYPRAYFYGDYGYGYPYYDPYWYGPGYYYGPPYYYGYGPYYYGPGVSLGFSFGHHWH
jgi:hypothetical protein